ncbi:MAG: hypothetical protein QHI48_11935 [Bacteroidota bacterium]|nr:hypothetical protein [Bacteroidota bacterium]
MGRRNRFNVFFVLFLGAVGMFVFASRERDIVEERVHARYAAVVRAVIPPLRLQPFDSALTHYVDADTAGSVAPRHRAFHSAVLVPDIGPDDRVEVTVISLAHDDVLVSPQEVSVSPRRGYGDLGDRTALFPFTCMFNRTGRWSLTLEARAQRIHPAGEERLRYRDAVFPAALVSDTLRESLEKARVTLDIRVEDTSHARHADWAVLKASAERSEISTALGMEIENILTVRHSIDQPEARVIRGFGSVEAFTRSTSETTFRWWGIPRRREDTVVIEFRTERNRVVKDVIRLPFAVHAVEPFLVSPVPDVAYAGEELGCNIMAKGLANEKAYSWELSEIAANREPVLKTSGKGPVVRYEIPDNFQGRVLRLKAMYYSRLYPVTCPLSYERGPSVFPIKVTAPPTHIEVQLPERPSLSQDILFTVYRYADPKFRGKQWASRIQDVKVEFVKLASGTSRPDEPINFDVKNESHGRFRISVMSDRYSLALPAPVRLKITSATARYEREFTLYP